MVSFFVSDSPRGATAAVHAPIITAAREGWEESEFTVFDRCSPEGFPQSITNEQVIEDIQHKHGEIFNQYGPAPVNLLDSQQYETYAIISNTAQKKIILAKHSSSGEKVVIKIPEVQDADGVKRVFKEYLLQCQAYQALEDSACSVAQPLGLMALKDDRGQLTFCLVTRFCSYLPGGDGILTMFQAMKHVVEHPQVSIREFTGWALDMIKALQVLQRADIYHNDLSAYNILLQYYNNTFHPVFTSFGNSSRQDNHMLIQRGQTSYYNKAEHRSVFTAPELFETTEIHETSDLYAIGKVLQGVALQLRMRKLGDYLDVFLRKAAHLRPGHEDFHEDLTSHLDSDRPESPAVTGNNQPIPAHTLALCSNNEQRCIENMIVNEL